MWPSPGPFVAFAVSVVTPLLSRLGLVAWVPLMQWAQGHRGPCSERGKPGGGKTPVSTAGPCPVPGRLGRTWKGKENPAPCLPYPTPGQGLCSYQGSLWASKQTNTTQVPSLSLEEYLKVFVHSPWGSPGSAWILPGTGSSLPSREAPQASYLFQTNIANLSKLSSLLTAKHLCLGGGDITSWDFVHDVKQLEEMPRQFCGFLITCLHTCLWPHLTGPAQCS